MAVFQYQAIARSGKKVKGLIDADSPAAARRKLRDQSLFPTDVQSSFKDDGKGKQVGSRDFGRISVRDLAMLTRQLGVLLHAGMPLIEALSAMLEQTVRPRLRKTVFDVRDRVREGKGLGDSMAEHPKVFSLLYVNMVRAGEASGSLEQILIRLADILEHQARLRNKVFSTLAYPMFMIVFAIAIISFLMMVIVPRITALFEKQQQELPRLTVMLIGTSDFITAYWYLILAVILGGFGIWRYWISKPEGRRAWDRFKLRVPLFGQLHLKLVSGRLARTLGTMLQSGLTMMRALEVVNTVIQNTYIEQVMENVKADVRRGRDLAVPMKESGIFPPMLIQMVELGQRSGEIEDMLIRVADNYDEDVQVTIEALVSLLEPMIIIVMGLFVGLLVLSILLPILNMSTNI